MYRLAIAILLGLSGASSAPQTGAATDSDVTYVNQSSDAADAPPGTALRESRIEKLPLTIPGNVTLDSKVPDTNSETPSEDLPTITSLSANDTKDTTEDNTDLSISESDRSDVADAVPLESNFDRQARNFETTETAELVTEISEDNHANVSKTRTPPKFSKAPKLSYFQKPKVFHSSLSNLLENGGKRKFRSRCRCEKIWNCPKLQISVPRCPDEYFLCCF